jgi:purine-binding chemotaxis protein CheW
MNLADIRKKAEENRKSAGTEAIGEAAGSGQCPEMETSDFLVFEEPVVSRHDLPEEDLPAEPCLEVAQSMERSQLLAEPAVCEDDTFAEPVPVQPIKAALQEMSSQFLQAAPQPAMKKTAGYLPIERILSGRDLATASEDHSGCQTDLYVSEEVEEYLCFRVAHEEYAISIMAIKEIIKPRDVTEVPRMPGFITGVISLRGVIIPVMDMRLRLTLPVRAATGKERIIVLRRDAGLCGVLVDEVVQVARIRKSDIEEPPAVLEGIDRDFVTGLGHFDSRMLILLNLAAILDISVH